MSEKTPWTLEHARRSFTEPNWCGSDDICGCDRCEAGRVLVDALDRLAAEMRRQLADYEEVLADHRRLVREMDVALNGDGAAAQASLCDLVSQVERRPSSLSNFVPRAELDRLEAQLREARRALTAVRESLYCTKMAPYEYDADHCCRECGSSSAWAKDVIDEYLAATEPKP